MYILNKKSLSKIEESTFKELNMTENDIEELLRNNIEVICDEEESLLIVGRQVKNESLGRSDLTAVDNNGSIVLIEIKRDKQDIKLRREAFEFQAIRYAASYATIDSIDELVKLVYAPYIDKYNKDHDLGDRTSTELGNRKIKEFLSINNSIEKFNENQRIILIASDFDNQTLSAVAWLNKNNVDISCLKLIPYKINQEIALKVEKILPLSSYEDYYVNLMDKTNRLEKQNKTITRRTLPKIEAMLEWGIVKPGDIIVAKNKEDEAVLLKNGNVKVDNNEISLQQWLKSLYGWSSVETYGFSIQKSSGKTLSELRKEYMEKELLETSQP
jgi:CRISPR/Cas system-associated endoribonuclease Cas2